MIITGKSQLEYDVHIYILYICTIFEMVVFSTGTQLMFMFRVPNWGRQLNVLRHFVGFDLGGGQKFWKSLTWRNCEVFYFWANVFVKFIGYALFSSQLLSENLDV